MKLDLDRVGHVLVARIGDGRVDAYSAPELRDRLAAEIGKGERHVVVDLSSVYFVDSSGLGALIRLVKVLPPGGNIVLSGCRPSVLELLKLTRVDRILETHATEAEAIASFDVR